VDAFHKKVAFLMYNATWRSVFFGNLPKLRCHSGIMEAALNKSVSEKMSICAEMPFLKVNGKSEMRGLWIAVIIMVVCGSFPTFHGLVGYDSPNGYEMKMKFIMD